MAEHPTTSWQAMQDGNVFYRQQRFYTLDGKLPSIGDCVVAGCRNGGPLGECSHNSRFTQRFRVDPTAFMRDTSKMIAIATATPMFAKSQVQVYSSAGEGLLLLSVRTEHYLAAYGLIYIFSGIKLRLFGLVGQVTRDW
jgi:vacuolar protein sorting-associated protein 16